jgi:hypothetical protein
MASCRSAHILQGMLMRGFTTVRDAGGADWGLAQAVEEGDVLGPRLLFTGAHTLAPHVLLHLCSVLPLEALWRMCSVDATTCQQRMAG